MATTQTKTAPAAKTANTKPQPQASTAVAAKPANTAVAVPTTGANFGSYAGAGFENAGREDYAIPFLIILQSGSPQCKRSDGAYIPGAAEGMLLNSVTKELYNTAEEELQIVPCAYDRSFIEWVTREEGGGFVRQLSIQQGLEALPTAEKDEKSRDILPNGHQLNDTRSFYVMVIKGDEVTPAFITMTSTQIKKSKQWLMQQNLLKLKDGNGRMYTPPMFAAKWRVSTIPENNDKGSWFGWAFEFVEFFQSTDDPTFQSALVFHQSITKGDVKMDLAKAGEVVDAETGEITGKRAQSTEDKDPARAM